MNENSPNTRIEHLVRRCLDLPPQEREAFIERVAGHDDALMAEMFERVAAVVAPQYAPEEIVTQPTSISRPLRTPEIPRYRIRRELGRGGMGVVYLAEQLKPVRRDVALKLMRPSIGNDPGLLARFEVERQVLAMMNHPAIARVFDAGVTGEGQPWFAMEYVDGAKTLMDYVQGRQANERVRLEIFATVCEAVHHGHQKGVIHRDLKPANILVDREGHPKVIDFGVARLATLGDSGSHPTTQTGQILGTPEYMSPEQCASDARAADARSDVYALGVILYELVTDRLPYEIRGRPLGEVLRVIRDETPISPRRLRNRIHADLATIIEKALEKAPDRRFASAHEFAADVRRYLAREPIHAQRPSALYYLRAFGRRHRAAAVAATSIVVIALAGATASTWFAIDANSARSAEAARNHELERLSYKQQIGLAAAALAAGDGSNAKQVLEATAAKFRGFEFEYLESQADQSIFATSAFTGTPIALRNTGVRIVAANTDGVIATLSATSGAPLAEPVATGFKWSTGVLAANGRTLIAGCADYRVRRFDATTGDVLWASEAYPSPIVSIDWNEVGNEVAVCVASLSKAMLLVATDGSALGEVGIVTRPVLDAKWSPSGERLVIRHVDGICDALIRTAEGRYSADPNCHPIRTSLDRLGRIAFSPDGNTLALRDERLFAVYDYESASLSVQTGDESVDLYGALEWLGDFILVGRGSRIDVLSGLNGSRVRSFFGHRTRAIAAISSSPDRASAASIDTMGTVHVFAAGPDLTVRSEFAKFEAMTVCPSGERAYTGHWGALSSIDLTSGAFRYSVELPLSVVSILALDRSESRLVAADEFGRSIVAVDPKTGTILAVIDSPVSSPIRSLQFLNDENLLAGLDDGSLVRISLADSKASVCLPPSGRRAVKLAIHRDGTHAAVVFGELSTAAILDGVAAEWVDIGSGKVEWSTAGTTNALIRAIALNASGSQLAIAYSDSSIATLDSATGVGMAHATNATEDWTGIAYMPDDSRLGAFSSSNHFWLFEPSTLSATARLASPGGYLVDLTCSNDGRSFIGWSYLAVRSIERRLDSDAKLKRGRAAAIEQSARRALKRFGYASNALRQLDDPTRDGPVGDALRRRPEPARILNGLAWERVRLFDLHRSEYEFARGLLLTALEKRPRSGSAVNSLAFAELHLGNFTAALAHFERCDAANRGVDPSLDRYHEGSHPLDLAGIARCWSALGERVKAEDYLRRATESVASAEFDELTAFMVERIRSQIEGQ